MDISRSYNREYIIQSSCSNKSTETHRSFDLIFYLRPLVVIAGHGMDITDQGLT